MKTAAIYARVSSDKQKEENTIASQTAALVAFASEQGYAVPGEWVFEDEGYSGASLIRPGLERVRDLVAEGQLDAVLVYAPDRLSRRYAYQVLLIEEFARAGVETLFIRSPRTATAEDQLLLQFQGMIAEYERAQILERSRRGKRHRARQGQVSVLSGAPFGYRYVRKSEQAAAYYEIDEVEAPVVRLVYERYTVDDLSIGAITRLLNDRQIPTRKQTGRWERSTVWAMLRNPAYKGAAGFGKTQTAPRQRITRPIRLRGGIASRDSAHHERPQDEWIAIAVPSIIDEPTFALAQERLQANKTHAPRRTIVPSVVQGLVSCAHCGYALYRTSTRSSARTIYYYRCLGSDAWRRLGGPICPSRPIRQDLLDAAAWTEIVKLLEDPSLIQSELNRRLEAARHTDPTKRREAALRRDLTRLQNSIGRLLAAYQEDLLSLDELRHRMPDLRQREYAIRAELPPAHNYLHYVFDLWAERWRRREATGDMIIMRHADDLVVGFEHESDARRFWDAMRGRLREFALTAPPGEDPTAGIRPPCGGRSKAARARQAGDLRFPRLHLHQRQIASRRLFWFSGSPGATVCGQSSRRSRRSSAGGCIGRSPNREIGLRQVVAGFFAYHAVPTNFRALLVFHAPVKGLWYRSLRRRGQRDQTTWERIATLADEFLPQPHILHPWPNQRFDDRRANRGSIRSVGLAAANITV